jgi:glycerol-3-phosphate dehydrogenase
MPRASLPTTATSDIPLLETEVLIIGGGVTGVGIMRDLALRGIHSILVDKRDLCAGASGGNHGLLHSGARYVSNDLHSAVECRREGALLKQLAPHCIESTGGLFVAVEGDEQGFIDNFPHLCLQADISCELLTPAEARLQEPHLSDRIVVAYRVPDATVDPFRLALENVDHARTLVGSDYYSHSEVVSLERRGERIETALCRNTRNNTWFTIRAGQVVNAGGAWAMDIARLAGCDNVHLLYSKGTLLVSHDRITNHVINRLRHPGDGDILVPGGTVSVLGTTSVRIDHLENIRPTVAEIDLNIREGAAMVPMLAQARYIRAFSRVRPLLQPSGQAGDRDAARGFALLDHESQGLSNFCTITGGKLTTFRLMAEKASDLVATRLGNREPCRTMSDPLPSGAACRWTEPGAAPKYWFKAGNAADMILCECEMVPQSAIDEIVDGARGTKEQMSLEAIALRSRAGKGACQGSFCGIRICSYLYDRGYYSDHSGLLHMRNFFNERFKGQRGVVWGQQAAQMELAEALHCGLLGLDALETSDDQ